MLTRISLLMLLLIFARFCDAAKANNIQGNTSLYNMGPKIHSTQESDQISNVITFSEFPLDTYITDQYSDRGIVFGGDTPFIVMEVDTPNSPTLSGTPEFQGAIEGTFVNPKDGVSPIYAYSFSVDAGAFNTFHSTQIEWFDRYNNKIGDQNNSAMGVEHFQIFGDEIARWRIDMTTEDRNGFVIDNVNQNLIIIYLNETDDVNDGDCVTLGRDINYTICYNYSIEPNYGELDDVNIIDYLPDELEFVSASGDYNYDSYSHAVTWNLGTVHPNDSNCFTITTRVLNGCFQECGVITNSCEIKSSNWILGSTSESTPVCSASNPYPTCGGTGGLCIGEPPDVNLLWCPGRFAADTNGHDVYFGTDFNFVSEANVANPKGVYKGRQTQKIYTVINLLLGQTYYWRIDEVNGANLWRGPVWMFTTGLFIDDFQRYNDTNSMLTKWKTGYSIPVCDISTVDAELELTSEGFEKRIQFGYDNYWKQFLFSEARIDYGPNGVDWTVGTAPDELKPKTLSLEYADIGLPSEPNWNGMYLAVEDTAGNVKVTLNLDPNAQKKYGWRNWEIRLADLNHPGTPGDVNLKSVRYFYLGFGVRCNYYLSGGFGTAAFDNIRLYPRHCVPEYGSVADFTGDCVVDLDDLKLMCHEWLTAGVKTNIYPDSIVNFKDYSILVDNWRKEILWPPE